MLIRLLYLPNSAIASSRALLSSAAAFFLATINCLTESLMTATIKKCLTKEILYLSVRSNFESFFSSFRDSSNVVDPLRLNLNGETVCLVGVE